VTLNSLLPWLLLGLSLALLGLALAIWWLQRRQGSPRPLPTDWPLSARPVFSSEERRVYRQLREALPHHVILAKLPLMRFTQPHDPKQVRHWYGLLGHLHVSFAICSANGRVLAAIDMDQESAVSGRALRIKQSVLAACRIRYLRCSADHLPSVPELQLLVPQHHGVARVPQPGPAPEGRQGSSPGRGRARTLWHDSGFMQDSFFGPDPGTAAEPWPAETPTQGAGSPMAPAASQDFRAVIEGAGLPPSSLRH